MVTDNSNNDMVIPKPGTLYFAVVQQGPLWIIFERNMIIELSGLTMQYVNNVIIHEICVKKIVPKDDDMIRDSYNHFGLRTKSDDNAISLFGASNIWIDHVSLSDFADDLIDVIMGSTTVTISNCHMTKHNDVVLFGVKY
ncbi:putative pectate lyase 3, partial [Mucuna pruriens]